VKTVDDKGIHFYKHEVVGAEMAAKILHRLKYPNEIINDVTSMIRNHMRLKDAGKQGEIISDKAIRKLIQQSGDALELILHLIHADNISHAPDYCQPAQIPHLRIRIAEIVKDLGGKTLPVSGKDIMFHFKIKGGKQVGQLLSLAEEIWHENPHWETGEILKELENRV
jgi:tRNA nucleotidyltransferase/poly(A) polymerase